MTEQQVTTLIGQTLGLGPDKLHTDSVAHDFVEWDSMGMLNILTMLDREGIHLDPGGAVALQSVQGILTAFRQAGKLG